MQSSVMKDQKINQNLPKLQTSHNDGWFVLISFFNGLFLINSVLFVPYQIWLET